MTLPDYTLRYSQKANYLQLRISVHGLEVVVPEKQRLSKTLIEQFVQQKKSWIMRHWQRLAEAQAQREIPPLQLPTSIKLLAIEQRWEVFYLATAVDKLTCSTNQSRQIKFLGDISDTEQCIRLLRQWLKKMAAQYLREPLHQLAIEHGLSFNQFSVRHTLTRWGSCSHKKNISLCCNLLFLPAPLMRHVLLHELCHTKVMTHGARFWQLLQKLDKDYEVNKAALAKAGQYVPAWALPAKST